jgi:glycosyltransferase involved in cell wall biosynthesis
MHSWIKSRIFRQDRAGPSAVAMSHVALAAVPAAAVLRRGWLFVLPWEPTAIGGVSRVVNELASSLAHGLTYDPCILVLDWDAREPIYHRSGDATVIRLRMRGRGAPWSRQRLLYWLTLPLVTHTLRRILSQMRISVVNAHYPTDQALELLRTIRSIDPGIKTVVSFHGSDICQLSQLDRPALQRWIRELGRATVVTLCSAGLRERLHGKLGTSLANAVVRRNGASRWKLATRAPAQSPSPRTVLSVGTYHVNKAHEVLIGAFDLIAREHPDLHLVIVGRTGPTLADIVELVHARGLDARVTLKTDVALDDMGPIYDGALMFVSASRFEPFGISILEAGTAGLPVIATDTDGAKEILDDGTDSIIVPVEDVQALARAMALMARSHDLRERLSCNLRAKVLREFQWDKIALDWEALVADRSSA